MALLRVNELPRVLSQLTTPRPSPDLPGGEVQGRVLGAMLMGQHGALLGSSGFDAPEFQQDAALHPSPKVMSAIVANVWADYAAASSGPQPADGGAAAGDNLLANSGNLCTLMLELEHGQLAVAGLCGGDFLLCGYADTLMQPGMLKIKLLRLASFLEESLSQLAAPETRVAASQTH